MEAENVYKSVYHSFTRFFNFTLKVEKLENGSFFPKKQKTRFQLNFSLFVQG